MALPQKWELMYNILSRYGEDLAQQFKNEALNKLDLLENPSIGAGTLSYQDLVVKCLHALDAGLAEDFQQRYAFRTMCLKQNQPVIARTVEAKPPVPAAPAESPVVAPTSSPVDQAAANGPVFPQVSEIDSDSDAAPSGGSQDKRSPSADAASEAKPPDASTTRISKKLKGVETAVLEDIEAEVVTEALDVADSPADEELTASYEPLEMYPAPDDSVWPRYSKSRDRIATVLGNIISKKQQLGDYAEIFGVPVVGRDSRRCDLQMIQARLINNYYRDKESLNADFGKLCAEIEAMHGNCSDMAYSANVLIDMCSQVVKDETVRSFQIPLAESLQRWTAVFDKRLKEERAREDAEKLKRGRGRPPKSEQRLAARETERKPALFLPPKDPSPMRAPRISAKSDSPARPSSRRADGSPYRARLRPSRTPSKYESPYKARLRSGDRLPARVYGVNGDLTVDGASCRYSLRGASVLPERSVKPAAQKTSPSQEVTNIRKRCRTEEPAAPRNSTVNLDSTFAGPISTAIKSVVAPVRKIPGSQWVIKKTTVEPAQPQNPAPPRVKKPEPIIYESDREPSEEL